MAEITNKNISGPLRHLLSLDFGRTSPLLEEVAANESNAPVSGSVSLKGKKVRFADHCDVSEEEYYTNSKSKLVNLDTKLKSILKSKLSLEEQNELISHLNMEDQNEDYSDFSSDDYSSDSSERRYSEQEITEATMHTNEENREWEQPIEKTGIFNEDEPSLNSLEAQSHEFTNFSNDMKFVIGNSNVSDNISRSDEADVLLLKVDENKSNCSSFIPVKQSESTVACSAEQKTDEEKSESNSNKYDAKSKNYIPPGFQSPKPTFHFCAIPLVEETTNGSTGAAQPSKCYSDKFHSKLPEKKQMRVMKKGWNSSSNFNRSIICSMKQSMKLNLLLSECEQHVPSAKELKTAVFYAWYKVKTEEKSVLQEDVNPPAKEVKVMKHARSDAGENAFQHWKKKKELSQKRKKKNSEKSNNESRTTTQPLSSEQKKSVDEERNLVYKLWKQKKDEELKQRQEELKMEKMNAADMLKNKELQKQDAAAAFSSWKAIKKKDQEGKKLLNVIKAEAEKQKAEEKEDRDKEAREAYVLWLKAKEESPNLNSPPHRQKPPWNPPG